MQFPSHWDVISPGDPIKKPVLEQFTAQIYRSKKWGWFRLTSYKHLISRVLLQTKPEPDFFSQLAALVRCLSHVKGWKMATTVFENSPTMGEPLTALGHCNLFLRFHHSRRTPNIPERAAKLLCGWHWEPDLLWLLRGQHHKAWQSKSHEHAKVAEGLELCFYFYYYYFFFGLAGKKTLNLNNRFWITFHVFWVTLHVRIAEKVLLMENAEILTFFCFYILIGHK